MSLYNLQAAMAVRGLDTNADSVSGALLYVFEAGTTTAVDTFTTVSGVTQNAHPVVSDSAGAFGGIFVTAGSYKIELRTPGGVTLPGYPVDNFEVAAEAVSFGTKAEFEAATIADGTNEVEMLSYATPGDKGGGRYILTDTEPSHAGRIQSTDGKWWVLVPDPTGVRPQQMGAKGNGVDSDRTAVFNAFEAAKAMADSYRFDGAGRTTYSFAHVDFGTDTYLITSEIILDDYYFLKVTGQGAIITHNNGFSEFPFKITGQAYNHEWEGIQVEGNAAGCFKYVCDNTASTQHVFRDIAFVVDGEDEDTAVGVDYTNRSGTLLIQDPKFNRVKHPVHIRRCDWSNITGNAWFGFPTFSSYNDNEAYIIVEEGSFQLSASIGAGGPAWYNGKNTRDGGPMASYDDVAFVGAGILNGCKTAEITADDTFTGAVKIAAGNEGVARDLGVVIDGTFVGTVTLQQSLGDDSSWTDYATYTTEQELIDVNDGLDGSQDVYYRLGVKSGGLISGSLDVEVDVTGPNKVRILLADCRLGFEIGAGALVNYYQKHQGTPGSQERPGVTLRNIQTFPREDKGTDIEGNPVATLVRLYEMPHRLLFDDIDSRNGPLALLDVASTTTWETLYAQIPAPLDIATDPAAQLSPNRVNYYEQRGVIASAPSLLATTNAEHYRQAEHMFGIPSFFFSSDNPSPTDSANAVFVDTGDTFSGLAVPPGAQFLVWGFAQYDITVNSHIYSGPLGYVVISEDENADEVRAKFEWLVDQTDLARQIEITGGWNSATSFVETVTAANRETAQLSLRLRHETNPGTEVVKCRGLTIRPLMWDFHTSNLRGLLTTGDV